jgi:hypothetical protein
LVSSLSRKSGAGYFGKVEGKPLSRGKVDGLKVEERRPKAGVWEVRWSEGSFRKGFPQRWLIRISEKNEPIERYYSYLSDASSILIV